MTKNFFKINLSDKNILAKFEDQINTPNIIHYKSMQLIKPDIYWAKVINQHQLVNKSK